MLDSLYNRTPLQPTGIRRILERGLKTQGPYLALAVAGILGFIQVLPNYLLAGVVFFVAAQQLYEKIDQGLPLPQLANLIAVLQWVLGPSLAYVLGVTSGRYLMYVDEATYFAFALPATCAYSLGILGFGWFVNQRPLLAQQNRNFYVQYGLYLLLVAYAAEFAAGRAPGSLAFFFYLVSQLRYVAAIYFILSPHRYGLVFAAFACSTLFIRSSSSGMFHDLLLWLAMIFAFWFSKRSWSNQAKLAVFALAGMLIFTIQVVKQDYREKLISGQNPSLVEMAFAYLVPGGRGWDSDVLSLALVRLNQGWIISAVMNHIPKEAPFANGQTIVDGALAAVAPRFLLPNKVEAGGRVNFRRFTGLQIADSTSMAVSPLGEAYANFGPVLGIPFMLLIGVAFAWIFSYLIKYALKRPDFLFWIPLIFYQALKAETEFSVVFNQLTKGTLIAFVGFYCIHQFVPKPQTSNVPQR